MTDTVPSPAGTGLPPDPLLGAALWLCRYHGIGRSRASLLGPLGLSSPLSAQQTTRVLQEAGMKTAIIARDPAQILDLLLPVVLLFQDGRAGIMLARSASPMGAAGQARQSNPPLSGYRVLVFSGHETDAPEDRIFEEAELRRLYSGYTLLATPVQADEAPLESTLLAPDADKPEQAPPHWLWLTLKRYIPYYRGAMLAALISNVLMMITGLFTSVVYDRVIPHQAMVTLWALAVGAFLAVGFDLLARQLRSHLIDQAGKKADLAMASLLFRKSLSIRLEHRPDSSGSFAHHMAQLEIVREFSTSASMSALSDVPFIVLFIAVTWLMAGPLAWVLIAAVPLILLLTVGVQQVLRRSMLTQQMQHADMQGLLVETVDGIETIRACGAQGYFQQQYDQANAVAAQVSLRARALSSWVNNVSMVSQQLVTVVMLVWGVHLIQAGSLTGGALMSAVMFGSRAIAPLGGVVVLASRYQAARAALRMLDRLMALPSEREAGKRYLPLPQVQGGLGLHEVSFAYGQDPQAQTQPVLKGVNLQIRPGERVAVLGKIGSGKSTVLRLLAGLYQPTQGLAQVDGIDMRQIDPADFRAHLGFVEQEPHLFRGTLRDNILLGRDRISPEALSDVLRLTGLDRLVAHHPKGLDMPVGEGGGLLSGGQRQLVALARGLVTNPRMLLMDEPTSSMDAQSEQLFIQQLKPLLGRRTVVVVTHRPAALELVDRIVVVDAGRIVLDGPRAVVLQVLSGQRPAPTAATAPATAPAVVPAVVPAAKPVVAAAPAPVPAAAVVAAPAPVADATVS